MPPFQLGKRSVRQSASSTRPRRPRAPHGHAHIHDDKHSKTQFCQRSSKRQRTSPLDVYEANDDDEDTTKRDPRYDYESQENYQYELPDQFDDEEIDEDGAFDADDEEKYGELVQQFTLSKPKKPQTKRAKKGMKAEVAEEANGNDDGEEDTGGWNDDEADEEGMQTLSSLLDDNTPASSQPRSRTSANTADLDDEDEDGMEEDEDNEETVSSKRSQLLSILKTLDSHTHTDTNNASDNDQWKSSASLMEESEFAAAPMAGSSHSQSSGKLTMNDLFKSLQGSTKLMGINTEATGSDSDNDSTSGGGGGGDKSMLRHRQSMASLKNKLTTLTQTKASKSIGLLSEPLADIHHEALTRQLGYERTKDEIERWTPIIEKNKQAPTLSFPLAKPERINQSSASLVAKFHTDATSSLESDLAAIIKQYGLKKNNNGANGDLTDESRMLTDRSLTEAEIESRRSELAKMKSLLFYHELKVRRMNKIKSKTYRKLKRKQKEKNALSIEELEVIDPEAAQKKREELELERIKERMSLTHSNSSQWMKRQLRVNATVGNDAVKQALNDTHYLASQLKQKIQRINDIHDSDNDSIELEYSDNDEDNDDNGDLTQSRSKASELRAALRALERETVADTATDATKVNGSGNKSGLLGLKFMQRAIEKKRVETLEARQDMENDLMDELRREASDYDSENDNRDDRKMNAKPTTVSGRRQLGPSKSLKSNGHNHDSDSVPVSLLPNSLQSTRVGLGKGHKARSDAAIDIDDGESEQQSEPLFEVEAFDDNDSDDQEGRGAVFTNKREKLTSEAVATNGSDSATAEKVDAVVSVAGQGKRKRQRNHSKNTNDDNDDANDNTDTTENPWSADTILPARQQLREEEQKARRRRSTKKSNVTDDSDKPVNINLKAILIAKPSSDSNDPSAPPALDAMQSLLVAEAFATGEYEEKNFQSLKQSVIDEELPPVDQSAIETGLPGWGHWAGDGAKPVGKSEARLKRESDKLSKLKQQRDTLLATRADAALPHVLINEKVDKKATRYLVPKLPFPYTTAEAYEASLAQPLGREWNAYTAHQKVIAPRIQVQTGAVIEPIQYNPLEKKEWAQQQQLAAKRNLTVKSNIKSRNERRGLDGSKAAK